MLLLLLCLNCNHSVYGARLYICISVSLPQTQSFRCLDSAAGTKNKDRKSLTVKVFIHLQRRTTAVTSETLCDEADIDLWTHLTDKYKLLHLVK